ncbi:MAG: GvpL/GvpF family gas vesicle protein [Deltaproteobacteria bacterium]
MSPGIYLFCLIPATSHPKIVGTGIDGEHPLFVEIIGEVSAVLAEVNIEEFTGPESQQKMKNLAWIGPRALRHETVVLSAMEQGPVLPVRFGTVFSSLAAAAEPLRQRQDVLMKFFRDTSDKKEWTLKGYVDRSQARARMTAIRLAAEKEQLAELSPGKRYFLEQKIKGEVDKDVAAWLKEMGRDLISGAKKLSVGFSACRLQSQDITGRDEEMFSHGALLVPDGSMAALEGMTDEWNKRHESQGLSAELSGPWPPYHFAPAL